MGKRRLLVPELWLLSGAFFFIFLGPGAIQQHLDRALGEKRFLALATVYLSFCFWRVFVGVTLRALGGFASELLGAATYFGFVATLWLSTGWVPVLAAAALWGWGAASLWITSQAQLLDATERHGASSGLFYAALTAGQALGVVLLGLAATRDALLLTSLALGVPGLVLLCFVPRTHARREGFSLAGFWRVARRRPVVPVGVILLCSSLSYGILLGVFSEISRVATGSQWPAVAFYVARVALCFPAGALGDAIGQGRVLKASFLLAAAGILAAALWRGSPGLSLALCAGAMAMQSTLAQSSAMALMGQAAPSESRHLALGAAFVWRDLGIVLPLFVAGALRGLLPSGAAVGEVFRYALFGFAAVFVGCAFLCGKLGAQARRLL
ncbi:MAG TPA: hypothetical protein VNE39_26480 [Planctomycetota bacterium]|nr:hypothetical protein [Planctomycetota bacterium]